MALPVQRQRNVEGAARDQVAGHALFQARRQAGVVPSGRAGREPDLDPRMATLESWYQHLLPKRLVVDAPALDHQDAGLHGLRGQQRQPWQEMEQPA